MKRASGHRNGAGNRVTVYERVTERVTELLSQGVVPWQKPWHAKVGPPRNGVSGRYYRGLNVFMLSHAGFESPWWFSPKQVNDLDGHIIKGEKVSWAHFFKPWLPKSDPADPLEVEADEAEISTRRPTLIIRAYRVVNLDQMRWARHADNFREKHPLVEGPVRNDNEAIAACDQIVAEHAATSGNPVRRRQGALQAVDGHRSHAEAPHVHLFRSPFTVSCSTSSVHSTGHEDRLNRKTPDGRDALRESDLLSARNLWQRWGAAFLCAMAGIDDPTVQNSASYINQLAEIPQVRSEGFGHRWRAGAEGERLHPRSG